MAIVTITKFEIKKTKSEDKLTNYLRVYFFVDILLYGQ